MKWRASDEPTVKRALVDKVRHLVGVDDRVTSLVPNMQPESFARPLISAVMGAHTKCLALPKLDFGSRADPSWRTLTTGLYEDSQDRADNPGFPGLTSAGLDSNGAVCRVVGQSGG